MQNPSESIPPSNELSPEHVGNFALGSNVELEVTSIPTTNYRGESTPSPVMRIVNKSTGQELDLSSLMPDGGKFTWGTEWQSSLGNTSEVVVPRLNSTHMTETKGADVLLPLFHEIGHAHRDPATSEKMLKNARWRHFSSKAEEVYGKDSQEYANALHFEFKVVVTGERNAWAHGLKQIRRVNNDFGQEVLGELPTADINEFVHNEKALGSYMTNFLKKFEGFDIAEESDLDALLHKLNADAGFSKMVELINRLYEADVWLFGVDVSKFIYHLDTVDAEALESLLNELETLMNTDPGWMEHDEFRPIISRIDALAPR